MMLGINIPARRSVIRICCNFGVLGVDNFLSVQGDNIGIVMPSLVLDSRTPLSIKRVEF